MLCSDINGNDPLGGVPLHTVKVAFLVKVSQPNIQRMHIITLKLNKWGKLCDEEALEFQLMSTLVPFILFSSSRRIYLPFV